MIEKQKKKVTQSPPNTWNRFIRLSIYATHIFHYIQFMYRCCSLSIHHLLSMLFMWVHEIVFLFFAGTCYFLYCGFIVRMSGFIFFLCICAPLSRMTWVWMYHFSIGYLCICTYVHFSYIYICCCVLVCLFNIIQYIIVDSTEAKPQNSEKKNTNMKQDLWTRLNLWIIEPDLKK